MASLAHARFRRIDGTDISHSGPPHTESCHESYRPAPCKYHAGSPAHLNLGNEYDQMSLQIEWTRHFNAGLS